MNKRLFVKIAAVVIVVIGIGVYFAIDDYRDKMRILSTPPVELFGWEKQAEYAKAYTSLNDEIKLLSARHISSVITKEDIDDVVEKLTGDDAYTVHYDRLGKNYEIMTIGEKKQRLLAEGFEDYDSRLNQIVLTLQDISGLIPNTVKVLEFEWKWRGKRYTSYGIATDYAGVIMYETIGYYILQKGTGEMHHIGNSVRERVDESLGVNVLTENYVLEATPMSVFGLITSRVTFLFYSRYHDGVHQESIVDSQRDCILGYIVNLDSSVNESENESDNMYGSDFERFNWAWVVSMDEAPMTIEYDGNYEDYRILRQGSSTQGYNAPQPQ